MTATANFFQSHVKIRTGPVALSETRTSHYIPLLLFTPYLCLTAIPEVSEREAWWITTRALGEMAGHGLAGSYSHELVSSGVAGVQQRTVHLSMLFFRHLIVAI